MTQSLLFWSATTLYAVSTILFFVWAAFRKERAALWGVWAAALGLVPHAAAILMRWSEVDHGPYSSRYEVLSSNAFILVSAFLITLWLARSLRGLGVFVMPAAFLLMGWAVSAFGVKGEVPIILKSYWLYLHITFAKLFAATILLASACALAYLIKSRRPERLARLPKADKLDMYSYQFLLVSFLFLGVMIAAGALWAHQSWGRYWGWDPIESSSFVTWLVFGLVLHFRALYGWKGVKMAYLTFVALAFSLATIYVVTMIVPTIHNAYLVGQ